MWISEFVYTNLENRKDDHFSDVYLLRLQETVSGASVHDLRNGSVEFFFQYLVLNVRWFCGFQQGLFFFKDQFLDEDYFLDKDYFLVKDYFLDKDYFFDKDYFLDKDDFF